MPTMPRREAFGSLGASRCPSREEPDEDEDEEEDEPDREEDDEDEDIDDGYLE
ncbi:MAG TPA: hypothetical protein VF772_19460 [Terriglobales bacterium]